ncbi:protein split ends isoform X2 [Amyelois transitella]|uniref:protein split ends isoform X2 n=1 Tax=Amyelois transitella TaxID=680683 RepID=UPI00298F849E|nr:protein split ends isoform X2 [Amyelois transitella]
MVRETRHLWVGNLPDNIREDRIRDHFKRYGRVQNVKLLGRTESANAIPAPSGGSSGVCATVAFMDIKSASKAHNAEHVLDERTLTTEYYEPAAIPTSAGAPSAGSSPAGSGYSGSSSSVNSAPAPASVSRYHLSGGEESTGNACPIAATAAAPANWRGTNDSATEYCRRGNTPAGYGRYQRNNSSNAPYSTPPSNVERTTTTTTPHHRWYASGTGSGGGAGGATGGESTPSTPGGGTEGGGRRRRHSGSGSSRSESSSPEPSDTSRASTPAHPPPAQAPHANHRTPPTHQYQWASTANGRPLAICVRNLPTRSTDSSLKDGLYHEYKKHGKVMWVKVVGQNADRYAVVRFKKPSDVEKALEVSQDKLFFGCKISVAPHQSCDEDADSAKPYETDIDEYHPKATRTLFIGNLEKDVTQQQLRDKFKHFGRIIEIDIKKGSGGGAGYAFCQYASISSVVEAIRSMDGEYVGGSRVKLGFGKPVATTCVWVDGLTEHTEKQEAFYEQLEKHGGSAVPPGERVGNDITGRYLPSTRHDSIRYDGSRSRASSYTRGSSRTPRYPALDHYDTPDYSADRRYRVYEELGSSPQTEDTPYEDRLQSVVVSPHRARRHRRDSSTEDRKHSKERHRSAGGSVSTACGRRSRSGSRAGERHARRRHRRRRDVSADRAGTPLRDEPDAIPSEPRRPPRERPALPMSLPLPRFAAQLLRAAAPTPRTAPQPAPAPDSPPRPRSASSSSTGSAPHSPSLEERIRSLDEKYERWSGSRALADAPDRARLRHRLLEVDINEVKPSEVVRSLLAKRSVFDEDSERLEGARAPSPGGSPRRSGSRPLRYPFSTHAPPLPAGPAPSAKPALQSESEVDPAERLSDPRLNRPPPERPHQLDRLTDYRIRPRTPSTDRSQPDPCERRVEELDADSRGIHERRRRDSLPSIGNKFSADAGNDKDSGDVPNRTEPDLQSNEAPPRERNITKDNFAPLDRRQEKTKDNTNNNLFERKPEKELDTLVVDQCEENIARDIADILLKQEKENGEIDAPEENLNKEEKEIQSNSDLSVPTEVSNCDSENKIEDTNNSIKSEPEVCKDILVQNNINDYLDSEPPHILLSASDLAKITKEVSQMVSQEYHKAEDKNGKEKFNQNTILDSVHTSNKLEKENIEFVKGYNSEKINSDTIFYSEKKLLDGEKRTEDRSRNDREKNRHGKERSDKDKHEHDKEKSRSHRTERVDRNEKEKKNKESVHTEKSHGEKSKSDHEKHKHDRENDRTKHAEEKSTRHDHHRKDKMDKDKRKDSTDLDSKAKKEDKIKHDKSKKESQDSKREGKKDSDLVKSRKSSRDDISRDLCRKDSTDSSTSRASHDSMKVKEESSEIKEDSKVTLKNYNTLFCKQDSKDLLLTTADLDSLIKVEAKEEPDNSEKLIVKGKNNTELAAKSKSEVSEKQRHYSVDSPTADAKRKERLNSCSSLPPNIGYKRRMSSHDSLDSVYEETKKIKTDAKSLERRDSKDSKSSSNHQDSKHKTAKFNKGHFAKLIESKTKDDKKNQVKPPDDIYDVKNKEESKDQKPADKMKLSKKSPKITNDEKINTEASSESLHHDLDFLATLELRSSEEDEKQRALRKEMKEKKRIQQLQQIQALQMQQDALHQAELSKSKDEKKQKCDDKKKEAAREKRMSIERKSREDKNDLNKRKNRKQLSTDSSDSDEPKKHSIFDIVDDGPTYISMYDKVKARSCKNMQKQEEEKRQEKIKAKFSQLKQSRAKREEKKRSSWDEDSDSEQDRKKTHKSSIDSSTDDDRLMIHNKKLDKLHRTSLDFDRIKSSDYFNAVGSEEDLRNKLSRKNSRTRIMSDTSDDERSNKRSISKSPPFITNIKKEIISDSESSQRTKDDTSKEVSDDKIKRNSLLNLFGKSDSEDSKLKSSVETDLEYKHNFNKSVIDFSSESESMTSNRNALEIRKKHKRKQKKHKFSFSDDDGKVHENSEGFENKHKHSEKMRRHSNKKEKRKDKTRESVDTDDTREDKIRFKKEKKPTNSSFEFSMDSVSKKEGKMEDIFGPLSDESDKEARVSQPNNKLDFSHSYESYSAPHNQPTLAVNCDESKCKEKDENKRKKEKRRRDKRYIAKEDENSLDVDAVSKAIEARLIEDTVSDDENRSILETLDIKRDDTNEFTYKNELSENNKINERHSEKNKKDCREKKKKKKRSREQRQSRKDHHHYHHHHDKLEKSDILLEKPLVEISNKTLLLDIPLPNEPENVADKSDDCKSLSESPSLPRLTESPPTAIPDLDSRDADPSSPGVISIESSIDSEYLGKKMIEVDEIPMPAPIECDISEVPLPSGDPAPIISDQSNSESTSFSCTLMDTIDSSETAVRSISNLSDTNSNVEKVEMSPKNDKKVEEKPRAIISQEETADAVAALLGESFGGKVDFSDYEQVETNVSSQTEIESVTIETETIPEEDAEEMRQAVQNLNACEMEMKPDTPVSDSDLFIDTDTEEADETPQDAIETLPINIIATNQSLSTSEEQSKIISKPKTTVVKVLTSEGNESSLKSNDAEFKIQLAKRETTQQITSTATPVITSWTLSSNKLEPHHVLNIQPNQLVSREKSEVKPTHITANIVQIKTPSTQNMQMNNTLRPIIAPARVSAPYQVINQIIRPQVSNMQPPTIKIPEQHILYQKSPGIVISPRNTNDPRLQSPKSTSQNEGLLSPRLTNMAILSTPQSLNSAGIGTPNMQQRSPGQVTVVRMQQPSLSPIQAMHLPHGARTMVSPSRPNSVLVQTQGAPIQFNRLPVTPVLAPISKQISVGNIVQNKGNNVSVSPSIHHSKIITTADIRKTDLRNTSDGISEPKIILSPTSLQQNNNPTVMAQNRLISMQNAMHVGNINTSLHLPNKVLINNINSLNEKRDTQTQKSDQHNHIPFGSPPIIHVAGVNHSTASIIQSGTKPVMCTIQEPNNINRSQNSNVIHTLNSPRLLTTAPISKVIQIDAANKGAPPSVLSMATIRSPTVLTRLESSNSVAVTTTSLTNVVMTPLLLKTTNASGAIRVNQDKAESQSHHNHIAQGTDKQIEEKSSQSPFLYDSIDKDKEGVHLKKVKSSVEIIAKCETDFEELLKDNTNEIKVTNDPEKKLEVNVGKTVTLITTNLPSRDRREQSTDESKDDVHVNKTPVGDLKLEQTVSQKDNNRTLSDSDTSQTESHKSDSKTSIHSLDPPTLLKTDLFMSSSSDTSIITLGKTSFEDIKLNKIETDDTNIFNLLPKDTDTQENQMKNLDENDSWSAKDVNIDSVIKKVDSLCNENVDEQELKQDLTGKESVALTQLNSSCEKRESSQSLSLETSVETATESNDDEFNVVRNTTISKRGGRSTRGKKCERNQERVQTRQISKPPRGGSTKRGRGRAKLDKKVKNFVNNIANNMPGDVYDFHEDSGDETSTSPTKSEARPRLILTIKSPQPGLTNVTSSLVIKDQPKTNEKSNKDEKPEDFISPSPNTRKSRRLQEKDVHKPTVDDVIDDIVKGPKNRKRPTRQAGTKANQNQDKSAMDTRKSPRGVKRVRDRSLSDASTESGDEKPKKEPEPTEVKVPRMADSAAPVRAEPEPPAIPAPIPKPVSTAPTNPTPIMKPPKKMISEISAKLASAFEAAVAAGPPRAEEKPVTLPLRTAAAAEAVPLRGEAGDAGFARRLVDGVAGLMPLGTDADARVQSPALPHRPPSTHRPADRATPVLMRGGEGEGGMGPGGGPAAGGLGAEPAGAGAGASRGFRGAYAGPASLPRGAHHPPHPAPLPAPLPKQVAVVSPHHPSHPGNASRVTLTSVPNISPQGQMAMGDGMYPHFSHQHYQMYQQHFRATQHESRTPPSPYTRSLEAEGCEAPTPPLELRRPPPGARVPRPAHSPAPPPADRLIMYAVGAGAGCPRGARSPPPAHSSRPAPLSGLPAPPAVLGPPHASQVPREADSLQMLLRRYPVMWQGLLALKNDSAAVQMHFVGGNPGVAGDTLPRLADGSTPLLRIAQRMRLEPAQLDQVHRKMKMENEHCMLLALPCGRDHMDVLQQSTNLTAGFITYLQRKQAAGIVNVAPPGHQQAMYTVHIFPSCDFANENLNRIAPDLMHRVADIAHLLIVIATV